MARTLTPERQKLKQDAVRLRQEMGWSERQIANHLGLPQPTIHVWLINKSEPNMINNSPLKFNTVHVMDCVDGMGKLPHESIDLVFADPPYNLGVSYGNGHFSTDRHTAYIEWSHRWFEAAYRILKPGGSFYAMQYPEVCALWLPRLTAIFTFQRWITWHYPTNIGQAPNNWTRSHRAILFCTKGIEPSYFDGIADAQPYRNPTDKRIKELIANGAPGVTPIIKVCTKCGNTNRRTSRNLLPNDKKVLEELYFDMQLSLSRIGLMYGVGASIVWARLHELGIKTRNMQEAQFLKRGTQKGRNNPCWKNGRTQNGKDGYVFINRPDHPRAHGGYVPEHILEWEAVNGKYLPSGLVIHHLNGIKNDNRIENLAALPSKKHRHVLAAKAKRIRELEAKVKLLEGTLKNNQLIYAI